MGDTECEKCGSSLKTRNDGEGNTWVSPCSHCKEELTVEIKRVGDHFRRSVNTFLVEGDVCPYCELLKKCAQLKARLERYEDGNQAEAINEKLGDLARDNVVLTRFLEKELDLLLKSNVDVVNSSCHRDSTVRLAVHCLRCGHDQYVLAEDTGVTLKCENPAGCTNRFRVERQEQETG